MKTLFIDRWLQCSGVFLACLVIPAEATEVALAGVFPGKVLVVINGGSPRALPVGATTQEGVRVIAVDSDGAVVEVDGRRQRLIVGQQALNLGGDGRRVSVTVQADSRGQFHVPGSINGSAIRFVVDTGATYVSLGRGDASRAGIDVSRAEPVMMQTANGVAQAWKVKLDSVRVGDVVLRNVDGIVQGTDMPFALLGMSFLSRMEMRHDGPSLQLRQRY
ncbi:MAG: TIGR02281 family clan AA aspartic protease [Proteobacteria bacterium]|nr:TIGR02281 family clan AA aspartic protease [Pseudomonadota bacterium]